jgi:hypothetical protein
MKTGGTVDLRDARELKHIKRGHRQYGDNLDRRLQELVDRGIIKTDMLTDVVAEHADACSRLRDPDTACNCEPKIYNMKDELLG